MIDALQKYLAEFEEKVNRLQLIPRVFVRYPFDHAALEIVSKAFALSRSCLALLKMDNPDEAYGLSRSLVDCAGTLRYLTEDVHTRDRRTMHFWRYSLADKNYWLHYAQRGTAKSAEMEQTIEQAKLQGYVADTKQATSHWSGEGGLMWRTFTRLHPLDGFGLSDQNRNLAYAVDYHQTSHFVHCLQPALDNYVVREGEVFKVSTSSQQYKNTTCATYFTVVTYLYSVLCYTAFGLNIDRAGDWEDLLKDAIHKVVPLNPPTQLIPIAEG